MEWLVPPLPWTVGPVGQRDPTKADMDELKIFRFNSGDSARREIEKMDTQTEVVECSVFTPGTLFRTIFKEPVIVGMNDVLETEWTKEGLQATLNGVKVESRTMVVCGGDKYRAPNTLGYHDVATLKEDYATLEELYKDEE
jgi:hypothetical protein